MKILYLSADNLRNTPFIKDLVFHYKDAGKSMIVHDHFGSIADTRFVTKRISALMSEEMITNNPLSGDQRGIFQEVDGRIVMRKEFLEQAFRTVKLLVLNAIGIRDGGTASLDALAVVRQLRLDFPDAHVHVFPKNSRSPLVASPRMLTTLPQCTELRAVFEEEALVLDAAEALLPVTLASPANFLQALA